MAAELPATVATSADHLQGLFPQGTPERYVIEQAREIREEIWTNNHAKTHILAGMVLALELIALKEKT